MAARAYWKGQIRLALVSIPVEVYSATKSGATVAFNQIHEPTGKRIKYEKVVPGVGPVDPDESEIGGRQVGGVDSNSGAAGRISQHARLDRLAGVERDRPLGLGGGD